MTTFRWSLLAGVALSALAIEAAQASTPGCPNAQFSMEVLSRFPRAPEVCLDVISRDGQEYGVFKARLERVRGNTLRLRFKFPDDTQSAPVEITPRREFRVRVDGEPVSISDLAPGQELTAYVKLDRPDMALAPAEDSEILQLVPLPEIAAPLVSSTSSGPVMPQTASPLPAIAWLGQFLLAAALTLTGLRVGTAYADKPPQSIVRDEMQELTATVAQIDAENRTVVLAGSGGTRVLVTAGPEVRNFNQIEVGDQVQVGFYTGLAIAVKPAGTPARGVEKAVATTRAPAGERPAGGVGTSIATTVTIDSVDTSFNTVTFKRADGITRTLAVQDPEALQFIRHLKPGDAVEITYTEAIAVRIQPAPT